MLTREDVQHVFEMRLIVEAKLKLWDGDPRYSGPRIVMRNIANQLESLVLKGPPEFRFVVDPSITLAQVHREQHISVFGRPPAKRKE
ncbi:MAG: hypothetical protein ABW128_07025 [Rhizorhabdus sp.]